MCLCVLWIEREELCALAKTYDAVVECGKDLTLSFIESPYDRENEYSEESCFTLDEKKITHYRFFNNNDKYANNVRLKYTRYVQTKRQELWSYSDAPMWYDEDMQELPFLLTPALATQVMPKVNRPLTSTLRTFTMLTMCRAFRCHPHPSCSSFTKKIHRPTLNWALIKFKIWLSAYISKQVPFRHLRLIGIFQSNSS